jgi:ABC-type nitrate/sulfonate/bicarbonate transport system substrate-binding protein
VRRTTIRGRPLVGLPAGYAAATAFWNVADAARPVVPGTHALRIDRFGAPPYPELVLATSRESLATNGPVIRAAVRALRRGYQATIEDPDSAVTALTDAVPALRRAVVARELDAVSPSFTAGSRFYGELDPARLATWAAWEQKAGIVAHRPNVARAFDPATAATGLSSDPNN